MGDRVGGEPQTSSTSFLSLRHYLIEHHDKEAFGRLCDELAVRHGIALPAELKPGAWLPTAAYVRALHVARELFGPPDFCERFGAAAAGYEIQWVHRVVLRFTSPVWLLERGADYWRRSHSTGRWKIESDRPHHLRGTLLDFAGADRAYCDSLRGWLERACAMTGAHHVRIVETHCRDRDGGDGCIYEGTW